MPTKREVEIAKEKALHEKLDKILEAVEARNLEEARRLASKIKKAPAKKPATKRTTKK